MSDMLQSLLQNSELRDRIKSFSSSLHPCGRVGVGACSRQTLSPNPSPIGRGDSLSFARGSEAYRTFQCDFSVSASKKGRETRSGGSVKAIGLREMVNRPLALPCRTITGPFHVPTKRLALSGNK